MLNWSHHHFTYWSHHDWAAKGKQQRISIWFGFTKFPTLQQTHNTQGLVMEVKVTNFSQGYVICERKGEERIKRFVSLDWGIITHKKGMGWTNALNLAKPITTPTTSHHHQKVGKIKTATNHHKTHSTTSHHQKKKKRKPQHRRRKTHSTITTATTTTATATTTQNHNPRPPKLQPNHKPTTSSMPSSGKIKTKTKIRRTHKAPLKHISNHHKYDQTTVNLIKT